MRPHELQDFTEMRWDEAKREPEACSDACTRRTIARCQRTEKTDSDNVQLGLDMDFKLHDLRRGAMTWVSLGEPHARRVGLRASTKPHRPCLGREHQKKRKQQSFTDNQLSDLA